MAEMPMLEWRSLHPPWRLEVEDHVWHMAGEGWSRMSNNASREKVTILVSNMGWDQRAKEVLG